MDVLKTITEGNIAEEGALQKLKERFKKRKQDEIERRKNMEEKKSEDYKETHDFSYREKDYSEIMKKTKPIIDKYIKQYPKVFTKPSDDYSTEFKSGEVNYLVLMEWDLWEFNPNARTDDDKNNEFWNLYNKIMKEFQDVLPAGYKMDDGGDWDGGLFEVYDVDLSRAKKKPSTESIDILASLSDPDNIAEEGIIKDLFTKKQKERKNDKNPEGFKYREEFINEFSSKIKNIINKYSSKIPSLKYVTDPEKIEDNKNFFNGKVNYFIMAEYKLSEDVEPTENDVKTIKELQKFAHEVEQLFTKQYFVRINTSIHGVCIFDTNTSPKVSTESIDILASLSDPANIAEEGLIKTIKDKVKQIKEKRQEKKKEKQLVASKKPEPTEEQKQELEDAKKFVLALSKKELSKCSKLFKSVCVTPNVFEETTYSVIIEICSPQSFYDLVNEDDDKESELWDEWGDFSINVSKQAKEKFPNLKFDTGDGDEGCIYIDL